MESHDYFIIPTTEIDASVTTVKPALLAEVAEMGDCAVNSMVDFTKTEPLIIEQTKCMMDARKIMEKNKLHLMLVVDDNHQIVGALSLAEILSENTLKMIESRRIAARKEIDVKTVMQPIKQCVILTYKRLQHAKVGNLIKTLHHHKKNYAIVIDNQPQNPKPMIRGVVLSGLISDQLGQNVRYKPIPSNPQSFYDLQHNLS